jgi:hypothetical protein
MPCELEEKDIGLFPGRTLFTRRATQCMKPTAIYLPPNRAGSDNTLDVVIWLHGFYVADHMSLFHSDPARIREQFRNSGKDVALIAPWLGYEHSVNGKFVGNYSVSDLATARWGERYLNQILAAISDPPPQVGKLVLACHSGGGNAMRNLVGTLGKYEMNLSACWGFDCLYGANSKPDDATFWYNWCSEQEGRALEIVFGPSTLPQSVKLDLIGRGLATLEGDRAVPERGALKKLHVTVGHYDVFAAFGQIVRVTDLDPAFVDRFMLPHVADVAAYKRGRHGDFLRDAITNVRKTFPFPPDIHYMIARGGLFNQLSKL